MGNRKFKNGTIIKGRDLQGCILCKIISEDMKMSGFQYKVGMNVDVEPLALKGNCAPGLHFALVQDICRFLDYGTKLAIVGVPDDEDVYVGKHKFRTHRLEIKEVISLCDIAAWKFLVENGADLAVNHNDAVMYAAENGSLEIVRYLHESGADITADDSFAVCLAARKSSLDVVKYLCENGADATASDNAALVCAASCGNLEIVKYLNESGSDINAGESQALIYAAEEGHLEVVEYLVENGADVKARSNEPVRRALMQDHLEVVEYLYEHGADITTCRN